MGVVAYCDSCGWLNVIRSHCWKCGAPLDTSDSEDAIDDLDYGCGC